MNKKVAFKEAVADTFLAFIINFPLNLLLIAIAFDLDFTALQTSIFLTLVFTTVAIIRKTYTRMYFETRNLRKKAKKGWFFAKKHYIIYLVI